jgi:sugar lactone lactonase YvrE
MSREGSMPAFWRTLGCAAALALLAGYGLAQQNATFTSYQVDDGWLNLPDGRRMGLATKVALDRDGRSLWAFDRCGDVDCVGSMLDPIAKFDPLGNLVVRFGAGMFNHPHGLHVDHDGNVWTTDDHGSGGKGHQVFKFSPQGKVLMTLGKRGIAGAGPDTFNAPTDVFVAPSGDVFISDGHGGDTNPRVVKFSHEGKFIAAWGKRGSGPGEFALPHALAMDSAGRLFVADRGNNRIEIFDQDGKFIAEWKQFGRPSGLFIDKNDILYCTDSESTAAVNRGFRRGLTIGSARDGTVTTFIPAPFSGGQAAGTRQWGESVAVDDDGNIFMGMNGTKGVERYERHIENPQSRP